MGYTRDTIRGVSWVGLLRGSTRTIVLVRTAILARVLTPSQFGVYGIASLVLALLEVFTETGVNVILVQAKGDIGKHISSAWIISIVRGVVIAVIIFLSAPLIAHFFSSKDSLAILQLISIIPLLRGFINPSVVKLQKELQFKREFLYLLFIFIVDASVSIGIALQSKEAISLVYGLMAGAIAEVVLSFVIVKPLPNFSFSTYYLKIILRRGRWITASNAFNYLFHNLDNIVVGKLLGTSSLGIYQMAYKISMLPITEVADVISRVTFPVYIKIAGDSRRLRKAFLKTMILTSLIVIPFTFLVFYFSREVVILLLGEDWLSAVPVLKVLAVFGGIRAISGSTSALFLAVEKQEYVMVVTLVSVMGLTISIIPLVTYYGVIGAGIAALLGAMSALPFMGYFTIKVLRNYS